MGIWFSVWPLVPENGSLCGFQEADPDIIAFHDAYLILLEEAQWSQGLRCYVVIKIQTGDVYWWSLSSGIETATIQVDSSDIWYTV